MGPAILRATIEVEGVSTTTRLLREAGVVVNLAAMVSAEMYGTGIMLRGEAKL
jgi:hypothetical protein